MRKHTQTRCLKSDMPLPAGKTGVQAKAARRQASHCRLARAAEAGDETWHPGSVGLNMTDQFLAVSLSPLRHADEHRVERKAEEVPDADGRCFRCQVSLKLGPPGGPNPANLRVPRCLQCQRRHCEQELQDFIPSGPSQAPLSP